MCDAVAITRGLIANNKLADIFAEGKNPERLCSHYNRCFYHGLEGPPGCYDLSRYPDRATTIETIMSVYQSGTPTN
jgi:hypothetical protein